MPAKHDTHAPLHHRFFRTKVPYFRSASIDMNKTSLKYPGPLTPVSVFELQAPATCQAQAPQAKRQLPSRKNGAEKAFHRVAGNLPAIPARSKRGNRAPIAPEHYLLEGGSPAVARHADHAARIHRFAALEQKHLDDTDTVLREMTSQWETSPYDAKALRAELRPKTDHLFAGTRIPASKLASLQPSSPEPVARGSSHRPGITKSPAPLKPRTDAAAVASLKTKKSDKNG